MVLDSFRKEFDIYNPETKQTLKVEMTLLDYIKYRQMEELIQAILRLKHG